jgi:hypothetical protein
MNFQSKKISLVLWALHNRCSELKMGHAEACNVIKLSFILLLLNPFVK